MLPLSRDKARIFRIAHVDNVPWILANGICCRASWVFDPNYRNIGNPELIEKRRSRDVPIAPEGTLSDYVPFYFTSRSPMLLNIKTGKNVARIPMHEIVIFVSSLPRLKAMEIPFVFTDRHAYLIAARFSNNLDDLDNVDWDILRRSDFGYDPNDIGKMDRYQAEALVHDRLPMDAVAAIICATATQESHVRSLVTASGLTTTVVTKPEYFFS